MNEVFKSVVKYCAINKLSINFSKTNYILVSSSRLSGSINVSNIKIKSQIKYLGVYIDQYLHWGSQIKHINNKLAKNRGIYYQIKILCKSACNESTVLLFHLSIFNLCYN